MRIFDAVFLNEIANSPFVRPELGGTDVIDLTATINNVNNFCFQTDSGGFLAIPTVTGGTTVECHTIFEPGTNARPAIRFMRQCQEYLFTRTNTLEIVTKVPDGNDRADKMATMGHFVEIFRREDAWKPGVGVSYRSLTLDRWLRACSSTLEAGKAFHTLLESAKKAKGSALPVHPDDEVHDRYVGAALLMAIQGNVAKATNFYNQWATFAGYAPVRMLSEQPPIVDVVDAIIGMNGTELQVLHCR